MKLKLCNNGLSVHGINEQGFNVSYSIAAKEYKQWLEEGNTPESEFTEEELEAQLQEQLNAEARAKLDNLDWKVIKELERLMLAGTDLNVEREELRASIV